MNQYFKVLDKYQKKQFLIILIFTFFAMIFETFSIISILPFLEVFFNDNNSFLNYEVFKFLNLDNLEKNKIYIFVMSFVIIVFSLKAIYLSYFSFKKYKFLFDFKTKQSNKLFLSYLYKPFAFHINTNSAQLIRNLNDSTLATVFLRYIIECLTEIFVFLGILIFLMFIDFQLTILALLFFGLIGFLFHRSIQKRSSKWGELRRVFSGLKLEELNKGFGAIRDIKLLDKEKTFAKYFSNNLKKENDADFKNSFVLNMPRIWFEWLTMITMLAVVFYLSDYPKSEIIVIVGLFAVSAYRLIPSLTRIMNGIQMIKYCQPAIKPYLDDLINFEDFEKKTNINLNGNIKFEKKIDLKNIHFRYSPEKEDVFKDISLTIHKDSFIGIYGESGVGKTTLINIILGLLEPSKGSVLADEINISKNKKKWHKLISYIPQNVFIIDDKISKNIALGIDEDKIDLQKLENSTKLSRIQKFIYSLPNKFETNCGELGEKLSGGQRQRISISRALYRNAEILIFDEFTNFLDPKNEEEILKDVKLMKNKTRIVVSHSKAVLKYCDIVYKLHNNSLERTDI